MRRFFHDESGATATMVALSAGALAGVAALTVDLGSMFVAARNTQSAADLAALAAVTNLEHAEQAAWTTAQANLDAQAVRVTRGRYTPDPALTPEQRFRPSSTGQAVRVEVQTQTPLFFGRWLLGRETVDITRTATAASRPMAAYSIGSRLAAVNGGAVNAVLSALTGSRVDISLMDYEALADVDVSLAQYFRALETELDLEAGTFDDTLDHEISGSSVIGALGRVLAGQGDSEEAAVIARIGRATQPDRRINLQALVGIDEGLGVTGIDVRMDALNLTQAVLTTANQNRQLQLSVSQDMGVASVQGHLAIGERPNRSPWLSVHREGVVVRTAQTRLYTIARVGAPDLLAVEAPLFVELASGEARLGAVDCGQRSVALEVTPSVGEIALGTVDPNRLNRHTERLQTQPATLLGTPIAQVTGEARVRLGGAQSQTVRFDARDIADQRTKTATTNDLAQATISSLLANTQINVRALGLGLGIGGDGLLGAQVRNALTALGAPLDELLGAVSNLTGARLGQADVTVHGLRCGAPALVG